MVKKIDIKPAVLDSGSTVSVQILKYIDGALSEDNTYTFDANDLEVSRAASNTYVAKIVFGTAHTEWIDGSTTQCFFDGVVCSPNDAYTLAGLVEADVTAFASGGGPSYTFPANHGNTAYVATGGDDGTGELGNISKPFETIQNAIAALDANNDGEVIILSSSSSQTIDDIDYSNGDCPEVLTIKDLCSCGIEFTGTINFATLFIETQGSVIINTDTNWVTGDYSNIQCSAFTVPDTMAGTILVFSGCIECDLFVIEENENASIQVDVVQWKKSCAIGVIDSFNYNSINPLLWIGKVSQVDTDAPTVDVVIRNDLGETLVPSRFNQGEYRFTITSGLFKNLYTFIKPGQIDHDLFAQGGIICKGTTDASGNFIEVVTLDSFVAVADNALHATDLTIEVYPEKY